MSESVGKAVSELATEEVTADLAGWDVWLSEVELADSLVGADEEAPIDGLRLADESLDPVLEADSGTDELDLEEATWWLEEDADDCALDDVDGGLDGLVLEDGFDGLTLLDAWDDDSDGLGLLLGDLDEVSELLDALDEGSDGFELLEALDEGFDGLELLDTLEDGLADDADELEVLDEFDDEAGVIGISADLMATRGWSLVKVNLIGCRLSR